MHMRHSPEQWRLFIDASKTSLKAVLLHNGNKLPSIPVTYAPSTKRNVYNYEQHPGWSRLQEVAVEVCGDFKVIPILLGLQASYTKYSCFLCQWDSCARGAHYSRKQWPHRQPLTPGMKNVIHKPLIKPNKVLPPPLYIKLGLVKNFIKASDVMGPAFTYVLMWKIPQAHFRESKSMCVYWSSYPTTF